MRVTLLGTGPVEGAGPVGCTCRRCLVAEGSAARRPAAAHIDGIVLGVDPPPVGLHVGALPAGTPDGKPDEDRTVLLVRDDTGSSVLWAPSTGPLPDDTIAALAAAGPLGAVVLGPASGPGGPVTPLPVLAHNLARLRAEGAAQSGIPAVLVGLTHDHPPVDALALRLAAWRMTVARDGDVVPVGEDGTGWPTPPRRTLVLGGSSSGKSGTAEDLLAAEPAVVYAATGPRGGDDPDWARRLQAHRQRRPPWWRTEEGTDTAALLTEEARPVLLDAVGTWLATVLDHAGAWRDEPGWRDRAGGETQRLVDAWRGRRAPVVGVSEEVGLGVVPATPAGRLFREELGRLNQRLAEESERVLLVVAGREIEL